jgi:hypothetical protein
MFWLKNRDIQNWRDVQNVDHVLGKYIISDRPMTEEQWAAERATVIDEKALEIEPRLHLKCVERTHELDVAEVG